jgi:hypothetical protein
VAFIGHKQATDFEASILGKWETLTSKVTILFFFFSHFHKLSEFPDSNLSTCNRKTSSLIIYSQKWFPSIIVRIFG